MKQAGPSPSPFAAERRERLRQQTGEAAQRQHTAEPLTDALHPGDLLVLPVCAAPLWWLVLKTQETTVTLIPGDDRDWAGVADLRVPADIFSSPLTLRCAFLTTSGTDAAALQEARRVGQLPAAVVRRAQEVYDAFESGTQEPTRRQEDDDFDALYQDWIETSIRPALRSLVPSGVDTDQPGRSSKGTNVVDLQTRRGTAVSAWPRALAAVLALALVGVSWGWWSAQRELGEVRVLTPTLVDLSSPRTAEEGHFRIATSGEKYVNLRLGPPSVPNLNFEHVKVEIQDPRGRLLWSGGEADFADHEPPLIQIPVDRLGLGAQIVVTVPDPDTGELTTKHYPIRLVRESNSGP